MLEICVVKQNKKRNKNIKERSKEKKNRVFHFPQGKNK